MTPLMFFILTFLALVLIAFALWLESPGFAAGAAAVLLIVAFGLFSSGIQETTGKDIVTLKNETQDSNRQANITEINATIHITETIKREDAVGILDNALALVYLLLSILIMYMGVFRDE